MKGFEVSKGTIKFTPEKQLPMWMPLTPKALQHGATAVQAPVQKGDEGKRGGFKDAWGTTWWVATKQG